MFIIIAFNNLLSISFSQIVLYINLYLLFSIFHSKKIGYKPDMILIYWRIAADVGYSFTVSIQKTYFLLLLCSNNFAVKNLSFYLLQASLIMGIVRATIALLLTLERFIAVFFPIIFHNNRRKIPIFLIICPILCHFLFDQYILFGFCGNVVDVPLDCDNFVCTFNECYQKYWETHDPVVFSLIETVSVLLFIRLFIWKNSKQRFCKVTQIALLDSLILLLFNIIPIFFYSYFSSTFAKVKFPLPTVSRNAGSVIESIILWRLLKHKKNVNMKNDNIGKFQSSVSMK